MHRHALHVQQMTATPCALAVWLCAPETTHLDSGQQSVAHTVPNEGGTDIQTHILRAGVLDAYIFVPFAEHMFGKIVRLYDSIIRCLHHQHALTPHTYTHTDRIIPDTCSLSNDNFTISLLSVCVCMCVCYMLQIRAQSFHHTTVQRFTENVLHQLYHHKSATTTPISPTAHYTDLSFVGASVASSLRRCSATDAVNFRAEHRVLVLYMSHSQRHTTTTTHTAQIDVVVVTTWTTIAVCVPKTLSPFACKM